MYLNIKVLLLLIVFIVLLLTLVSGIGGGGGGGTPGGVLITRGTELSTLWLGGDTLLNLLGKPLP